VALPDDYCKRWRIDGHVQQHRAGLLVKQRMSVGCGSINSAALLHRPPAFSK
jgi:hypothetical protein